MNENPKIETLGIIMDGNRRFAQAKGLPAVFGHKEGFENLKRILPSIREANIRNLIIYGFSTENWKRPEEEVGELMNIFRIAIKETESLLKGVVGPIKFIGGIERFPEDLVKSMAECQERTKNNEGLSLFIALSYGGRGEIVSAVNKIIKEGKNEITEDIFENYLYTSGTPDPDLIIRTGGEMRLSNFLLWQVAYSELFFTKTLWPAFTKEEFFAILEEYGKRKRNFGK